MSTNRTARMQLNNVKQHILQPGNTLLRVYYGLAVASPYVGMARFQDGGSNQCISVFTAISSPGNKY